MNLINPAPYYALYNIMTAKLQDNDTYATFEQARHQALAKNEHSSYPYAYIRVVKVHSTLEWSA